MPQMVRAVRAILGIDAAATSAAFGVGREDSRAGPGLETPIESLGPPKANVEQEIDALEVGSTANAFCLPFLSGSVMSFRGQELRHILRFHFVRIAQQNDALFEGSASEGSRGRVQMEKQGHLLMSFCGSSAE